MRCLLSVVLLGLSLVWGSLQTTMYNKCVKNVYEVKKKSLDNYVPANFSILSSSNLVAVYDETEEMNFPIDTFFFHYSIERAYTMVLLTEHYLSLSQYVDPDCVLTVEQPIFVPFYHEYYSNISLLWSSAVNQVQDMRQEIESVRYVQND
eukprot:gene13722-15782_t